MIAVVTLLTMDMQLPGGLVEGTHDLVTARTAGFTVLVFASLFNCFIARSDTTAMASAVLWVSELRKWALRASRRRVGAPDPPGAKAAG